MKIESLSISKLSQALKGSRGEWSLGQRRVYFKDNTSIELYKITERLFALGIDCLEKNYSIQDRIAGHCVKEKLGAFYSTTDDKLKKNAYIITYIFYLIRGIFDLDRENAYGCPESIGFEKLNYHRRLGSYELFQGFKSQMDYMKLALSRPLNTISDIYTTSPVIQIHGIDKQVHFYKLKEIGKFNIF